jgi:hypothetical protein
VTISLTILSGRVSRRPIAAMFRLRVGVSVKSWVDASPSSAQHR